MALTHWFRQPINSGFCAKLAPDTPLAVVGDLHGRADLLEKLLKIIAAQLGPASTLVFVGDYIDRGEHSARVLALLQELLQGSWPGEVVCLKGNHEAMMLEFLDSPERAGRFWLQNGGAQTLASFGIRPEAHDPAIMRTNSNWLRACLPKGTEAWLRTLPVSYLSGNLFVAHAGADPNVPVDQQDEAHLLWGHTDFERMPRRDGIWVAHGHTIRERASATQGRIGVDTGAYATNRLTAALIDDGKCSFVTSETS
jgi:serine/threonine protein phosphatase 1